jgi:hypothetical protein
LTSINADSNGLGLGAYELGCEFTNKAVAAAADAGGGDFLTAIATELDGPQQKAFELLVGVEVAPEATDPAPEAVVPTEDAPKTETAPTEDTTNAKS